MSKWLRNKRRLRPYRRHRVILAGHSMGAVMTSYLTIRLMRSKVVRRGDVMAACTGPHVGYRTCGAGLGSSAALFAYLQRRTRLRAWYAEFRGDLVPRSTDPTVMCPLPMGSKLRNWRVAPNPKKPHGNRNFMIRAAKDFLAAGGPKGDVRGYPNYGVQWPVALK